MKFQHKSSHCVLFSQHVSVTMIIQTPQLGEMNRSNSTTVHYESSYLKRMNSKKPPPSLTRHNSDINIGVNSGINGGGNVSSGGSIASLPAYQQHLNRNLSFNTVQPPKRNSTPMRNSIRQIRSASPIDMILDNARRRAATPLGIRRPKDQRSIAASPLSFYRAPSPMSVTSSYSQRLQAISRSHEQNTIQSQHTNVPPSPLPLAPTTPTIFRPDSSLSYSNKSTTLQQLPNLTMQQSIHTNAQQPVSETMQQSVSHVPPVPVPPTPQLSHYGNSKSSIQDQIQSTMPPNPHTQSQPSQSFNSKFFPPTPLPHNNTFSSSIKQTTISTTPPALTVKVPDPPVDAFSPDSQDAFIGIGSPEHAASPQSFNTGRHSAATEVRSHLGPRMASQMSARSQVYENRSMAGAGNHLQSRTSSQITMKSQSRENGAPMDPVSMSEVTKEEEKENELVVVKPNIPKKNSSNEKNIETKAIKFDPEHPDKYWSRLAVRCSSEILKIAPGKDAQKYAEAAQLAVIKAGESYKDGSPETLNLIASKASMAVLEAGGDARIAALATVSILKADDDTPSTEEEIRSKMIDLYGNARDMMKKSYDGSSRALTKFSEIASTSLKLVAKENVLRYQEYRLKAEQEKRLREMNEEALLAKDPSKVVPYRKKSQPGLLDYVDGFVSDIRHQYNRSMRDDRYYSRRPRGRRSRIERRDDYGGYSSEESFEYERSRNTKRHPSRRGHRSRSLSSYSDYSSESRRSRRSRRGRSSSRREPSSRKKSLYRNDDERQRTLRHRSSGHRSHSLSTTSSASYRSKSKNNRSSKSRLKVKPSTSLSSSSSVSFKVKKKKSKDRSRKKELSSDSSSSSSESSDSSNESKSSSSSEESSILNKLDSRISKDSVTNSSNKSSRSSSRRGRIRK